ncbi:PilT protein domain protein [Cylindrospermum sp. NIES-4074]|nr:PilT protein domain protein [Cylindrospermum sp. NIES-4074]
MYLLDTNHCSSIIFGNLTVITKVESIGISNVAISAITEGELLYMAENSTSVVDNLAIIEEFKDYSSSSNPFSPRNFLSNVAVVVQPDC